MVTVTEDATYRYYTFTGSESWASNDARTVDVLCVASGGSGAVGGFSGAGGAGGAGGVVTATGVAVAVGTYPVVVGGSVTGGSDSRLDGANGEDSSALGVVASGGGRGINWQTNPFVGGDGGSGGGVTGYSGGTGGAGTAGQGNDGGDSAEWGSGAASAGGGGAGGAGGDVTSSGDVAGDGGAGFDAFAWGLGTIGGGGGGGAGTGAGHTAGSAVAGGGAGGAANSDGQNGTANTGGGGGGQGGGEYAGRKGGDSGSGVVVFREALAGAPPPGSETGEDRLNVPYTAPTNGYTSEYHSFAAGLSLGSPIGVLLQFHGDGAFEFYNPSSSYSLGGPSGIVAACKARNILCVPVLTPNVDETWWTDGLENAFFVRDLLDHLGTEFSLDLGNVWLCGYSGGAQFVTKFFLPRHNSEVAGGGAIVFGGGGAPTVSFAAASPSLKQAFPMHWYTGADDTGTSPEWYNALADAQAGLAYYENDGWRTSYEWPAGVTHDLSGLFGGVVAEQLAEDAPDPAGVQVFHAGSDRQVEWLASPSVPDEYRVFRRTPPTGQPFDPVTDTPVKTGIVGTSWLDTAADPEESYDYQVFGVTGAPPVPDQYGEGSPLASWTSTEPASSSGPPAATGVTWEAEPYWRDEFEGTAIDWAKWDHLSSAEDHGGQGNKPNGQLEWNQADQGQNAQVSGSTIKFRAVRGNVTKTAYSNQAGTTTTETYGWTSALLTTSGAGGVEFQTGVYIEERVRLPAVGSGSWPAFWTWQAPGGNEQTEIDVYEYWPSWVDRGQEYTCGSHGSGMGGSNQGRVDFPSGVVVPTYDQAQHGATTPMGPWMVFGAHLKATGTDFYFNGVLVRSIGNVANQPMNIIANLAVWQDVPPPASVDVIETEIDWVRVWRPA